MLIDDIEYTEIELMIDGNCAIALIGPNIQEGTAAVVDCFGTSNISKYIASKQALNKLRKLIHAPNMPFKYHKSHPMYSE